MKKLIYCLFLLYASAIVAQTTIDDYYNSPPSSFLSKNKVSGSVSMGAGINYLNSAKNMAFVTFVAPGIGYQLTNKFKLNFGLMHYTMTGNTFMPIAPNEALVNNHSRSVSGNLLFVEGQYQLNKKTIMSGAVMYDVNALTGKGNNYKTASLGLNYRVSDHTTIGFRATLLQGNSNYLNPYSNSFDYFPYNNLIQNTMFGIGN